jgi:superfamily II DNA or RNA helicase
MRLELRDDQRRAVDNAIAALDRRPIIVAPTGSGKTVTATALVERLGVPALWLAHRKELIDQAAKRLDTHGLVCGIVMAGYAPMPLAQVQVASVQTLIRRDKPRADLIVVDECHHATADSYQSILDAYPEARIVGLTATPFRLDGRGLGDLFGELVVAAYSDELCDLGVLHRPKVWASRSPDLRGVKVIAGDYSIGALAECTNTHELNGDIVATWLKRAAGKRTVAFAVDVEHSRAITAAFCQSGNAAEHVDGSTPRDERDAILARLASGETLIVSNCMVLTEGWDLPALECAIIARPTASLNLHLQMIGRVMRAAEGKDGAIVLDHAGNHHIHGLVTRRLKYSLNGEKVGHCEPLGLRRCQQCGLLFELHEDRCPECGWTPTPAERERERPDVHGDGDLSEFDDSSFAYRRQIWNLIEGERQAMGYREGWSFYRYQERFGDTPVVAEIDGTLELIDPHNATLDEKRAVYERLIGMAEERGFKPGWASHKFREAFGCWPRGFVTEVRRTQLQRRWAEAGT